jgi:hypothetical protein
MKKRIFVTTNDRGVTVRVVIFKNKEKREFITRPQKSRFAALKQAESIVQGIFNDFSIAL